MAKKKDSLTNLAVKTGARAIAIAPGLVVAGIRDTKSIFFGAVLGSIAVSIFQIAMQTFVGSFSTSDDSDD